MNKHNLKGKVIIITGGTSGLGYETALSILKLGAFVVITGRNEENILKLRKQFINESNLIVIKSNACSTSNWKNLILITMQKWGRIDILINNHGAGIKIENLENMNDYDVEQIIDINLKSVIIGSREILPQMKSQGSGLIINISSVCAYHSWKKWSVYSAAKSGLVGFTKCLHLEMSEWGGTATLFVPGAFETNFFKSANADNSDLPNLPTAKDISQVLVNSLFTPSTCFIQETRVWGTDQVAQTVNPF